MILAASERIEAPRDFVFARAVEFDRLIRAAEARGAEVSPPEQDGDRLRCRLRYPFREAMWPVALVLQGTTPPESMKIDVEGDAAMAQGVVSFLALEGEATRVDLRAELRPRSIQGRLLIGSLLVLRGRVQERLERDLAAMGRAAEALWRDARG